MIKGKDLPLIPKIYQTYFYQVKPAQIHHLHNILPDFY